MISARQEIDLRPQLERLDRLILRSAGLDPTALTFEFRPLWQMDAAEKATIALNKAQATQVYAGLNLWPAEITSRLVQAQLIEDGIYPNAEAGVAAGSAATSPDPRAHRGPVPRPALDFDPNQPRDPSGRWTSGGESVALSAGPVPITGPMGRAPSKQSPGEAGGILGLLGALNPIGTATAQEIDPEEENRGRAEESADPTAELRFERYNNARSALKAIDPKSRELETLSAPDYVPSEGDIERVEAAAKAATIARSNVGPPSQSLPSTRPDGPMQLLTSLASTFAMPGVGPATEETAAGSAAKLAEGAANGRTRPTPRQSEVDVGAGLGPGYKPQKSYLNREEAPYGTPGSVRPDLVADDGSAAFEVKDYDIATNSSGLINNVAQQVIQRANHLPAGMRQRIIIDIRGQTVTAAQNDLVVRGIEQKSSGLISSGAIEFK